MARSFSFLFGLEEGAASLGRGGGRTTRRTRLAPLPGYRHTTGVLVFGGDEGKADWRLSIQPRALLRRRGEVKQEFWRNARLGVGGGIEIRIKIKRLRLRL
jgi:hypothetical protein